jgi:outer membrane protein assembly factor BamB
MLRLFLFSKLVVVAATAVAADTWPWYGGPTHNGVITGAETVPDGKDMKLLWKVRLHGTGHSGPAVVDGEVYLLDRRGRLDEGEDMLRVFDLQTGAEKWNLAHPAPGDCRQQAIGNMPWRAGPVSVPAVGNTHVFVTGAMGRLYCIDRKTHKLAWSRQITTNIPEGCGTERRTLPAARELKN